MRSARVLLDGEYVGLLEEREGGGTVFTHAPGWLQRSDAAPISLTMPLRIEAMAG